MASILRTQGEWYDHSAKLEHERDTIAAIAAREIACLREALRQIIERDGPGFPAGTCARIAEDALGPENVELTHPESKP